MLRPAHTIYETPFKVDLAVEQTLTPPHFKKRKPSLGKTIPTFPIFKSRFLESVESGVVASPEGFEEAPDAEMILGGINSKGPDYAAVARHGSFVLWGFHTKPSRFTNQGRRLYLNTLAYAAAHKGEVVETLRLRPARVELENLLMNDLEFYPKEERTRVLARQFVGEAIPDTVLLDRGMKRQWLDERLPFLHPATSGEDWETSDQLTVDRDVQAIGASNASILFLERIAARLTPDAFDPLSLRLLARYVPEVRPQDFASWLAKNRDRLYFTETGGWTWRIRGTRAHDPRLRAKGALAEDDPVSVFGEFSETLLTIRINVRDGWNVYAPGAEAGEPVSLRVLPGSAFETIGALRSPYGKDGIIKDHAEFRVPLRRIAPGTAISVEIAYTACDAKSCRPRVTTTLSR